MEVCVCVCVWVFCWCWRGVEVGVGGCCLERLNNGTIQGVLRCGRGMYGGRGGEKGMEIVHIKGAIPLRTKSCLTPSEVNTERCAAKPLEPTPPPPPDPPPPSSLWERWEKRLQRALPMPAIALNCVLELSYGKTDTPSNHTLANIMYQDMCTQMVPTSLRFILLPAHPPPPHTHTHTHTHTILCCCSEQLMGLTSIPPSSKCSKWTITSRWQHNAVVCESLRHQGGQSANFHYPSFPIYPCREWSHTHSNAGKCRGSKFTKVDLHTTPHCGIASPQEENVLLIL